MRCRFRTLPAQFSGMVSVITVPARISAFAHHQMHWLIPELLQW